jgi:hypothetical protein
VNKLELASWGHAASGIAGGVTTAVAAARSGCPLKSAEMTFETGQVKNFIARRRVSLARVLDESQNDVRVHARLRKLDNFRHTRRQCRRRWPLARWRRRKFLIRNSLGGRNGDGIRWRDRVETAESADENYRRDSDGDKPGRAG